MRLLMLHQVALLCKALLAELALERLFASVRAQMVGKIVGARERFPAAIESACHDLAVPII
jgi:hypothetical protein